MRGGHITAPHLVARSIAYTSVSQRARLGEDARGTGGTRLPRRLRTRRERDETAMASQPSQAFPASSGTRGGRSQTLWLTSSMRLASRLRRWTRSWISPTSYAFVPEAGEVEQLDPGAERDQPFLA